MRKLHPATIVVALLPRLREAVSTAFPLIIGTFFAKNDSNHEWIGIFIVAFTGIFAVGTYWTTRFDVVDDHIVHTTGWIFRKDRRIPLVQIQNVGIRQNLLERIFRVATIDVETAMGHGRDMKLSVLSLPDAEKLREELLGAIQQEEPEKLKTEEPILKLTQHDLLLGAITENHLAQMIITLMTVGGPSIGIAVSFISELSATAGAFAMLGAIVFAVLASWLWGVISYFLKFGGFTVLKTEGVFRISYGLINKVQTAIRPSRIEYLHITTSIIQRWLERSSFHAGTASSFGEAGVLAPFALYVPKQVAYHSASTVIPGLDIATLRWQPLDPIFYIVRTTRSMIFLGVLACIVAKFGMGGSLVRTLLVGISAGVLGTFSAFRLIGLYLSREENGFAITEDALVTRMGYLQQSISAIPIERVENIAITQPWWWKKRRASSLMVQGMKHRVHVGAMPESAVAQFMNNWQKKLAVIEERRLAEFG